MKKIIPFLAIALFVACTSKSEKTLTLDTPVEGEIFKHGETIYIGGELKTGGFKDDEAIIRVYNLKTGEKIMEEFFNYNYEYTLLSDFADTTQLEVQLYLQKEDSPTEELKKKVTITCLPE